MTLLVEQCFFKRQRIRIAENRDSFRTLFLNFRDNGVQQRSVAGVVGRFVEANRDARRSWFGLAMSGFPRSKCGPIPKDLSRFAVGVVVSEIEGWLRLRNRKTLYAGFASDKVSFISPS